MKKIIMLVYILLLVPYLYGQQNSETISYRKKLNIDLYNTNNKIIKNLINKNNINKSLDIIKQLKSSNIEDKKEHLKKLRLYLEATNIKITDKDLNNIDVNKTNLKNELKKRKNKIENRIANNKKQFNLLLKKAPVYNKISIGVGVPAVSIQFDGKIGYFDSVSPMALTWTPFFGQNYLGINNEGDYMKVSYFSLSFGTLLSKAPTGEYKFGLTFSWNMRFENFLIGLGFNYQTEDKLRFKNKNFSVIIPISYSL